jgi:hypothetical protein
MSSPYHEVARRIGLACELKVGGLHVVLDGLIDGVQVHQSRYGHILISRGTIAPPIGHGIEIARTGLVERLGSLFGAPRMRTGDAAFDEHITVHSHGEPETVQLLTRALKEYLLRLHATGVDFTLADDHAEVRRGVYFPADEVEEVIEGDLRVAASLVRLVDEGRARL